MARSVGRRQIFTVVNCWQKGSAEVVGDKDVALGLVHVADDNRLSVWRRDEHARRLIAAARDRKGDFAEASDAAVCEAEDINHVGIRIVANDAWGS